MSEAAEVAPRALVIGHGGFAAGLISAVDQSTGRGALLIGVLNNGLNLLDVSSFYQQVIKGGVILLAVLIDRGNKKS